ncbi:hypothetical protein B005_3114 [Nocardiopsis alba ATCC BAA-2165]|uniref:Uncharacterized protein n=1 Tax=Nocardiopsis alba (strain ATCC BAA-2165 / BE74) TaxID=1205910 RepID=J7LJ16_NOCAA|nr:hypothetical protein B005_3114 [Nocardiopsis alba ATCC BAA-2165]
MTTHARRMTGFRSKAGWSRRRTEWKLSGLRLRWSPMSIVRPGPGFDGVSRPSRACDPRHTLARGRGRVFVGFHRSKIGEAGINSQWILCSPRLLFDSPSRKVRRSVPLVAGGSELGRARLMRPEWSRVYSGHSIMSDVSTLCNLLLLCVVCKVLRKLFSDTPDLTEFP